MFLLVVRDPLPETVMPVAGDCTGTVRVDEVAIAEDVLPLPE